MHDDKKQIEPVDRSAILSALRDYERHRRQRGLAGEDSLWLTKVTADFQRRGMTIRRKRKPAATNPNEGATS